MTSQTVAYHLVLRPAHPHDAALIADIGAYPTGRRARRVRELLLRGLSLPAVPIPWIGTASATLERPGRLRIAVYVHASAGEDAPLRDALVHVHDDLVADFLRERLAAGLLGCATPEAAPAPGAWTARVTPAILPPVLAAAAPSAPMVQRAAEPGPPEASAAPRGSITMTRERGEAILRGETPPADEPSPAPTPVAGRKRRQELMGLMGG